MAMTIHVPEDLAAQVERMVADGTYPDADSVVRDALRLLANQRDHQRLIQSIRDADRSMDEGRVNVESNELWDGIHRRAMAKVKSGKPINPDVLP